MSTRNRSFLRGAAVLGLAGVFVKILGAVYQLPFAAMMGGTGLAYYKPAYDVYTVFIVISTSGIPVAVSRMVSERIIVQNHIGAHRVFKISFKLMLAIGLLSFAIMFFGADAIAKISAVPESALSMRFIAPALIIVPVMAAFRGYYQGQQNMKPTALSQIFEQVFRVIFGLGTAYLMLHAVIGTGLLVKFSTTEKGAAGGAFGATIGSLAGLAVMLLIYMLDRKNIFRRVRKSKNVDKETDGEIFKKILAISVPITLGACIAPIMSYLDSPIVVTRLTMTGWGQAAAKNLYGQISYATTIVNLPQALSMALSMSLVPLISSAHRTNDIESMQKNTSLAVRVAVLIGMPCAVGMLVLAKPILLLLYSSHYEEAVNVAPTFAILAVSVIFVSIIQTVSGILQGVGKQNIPVRNMLIGIVIKVVTTFILVGFKGLNIKGAGIGTLLTYIVVAILDLRATKKYTGARFDVGLTLIRPLAATGVMAGAALFMYYIVCGGGEDNKIGCLIAVFFAALVYCVMLFVTKSIKRGELENFSFGRKIGRLIDKISK